MGLSNTIKKKRKTNDVVFIIIYSFIHFIPGHVAALPTLKANWFDTPTVKQWEIMLNNDELLFSATVTRKHLTSNLVLTANKMASLSWFYNYVTLQLVILLSYYGGLENEGKELLA